MTSVDLAAPATQEAFGALVGISQQQVAELVQLGALDRDAPLGRWLLQYTARLREQAAGRSAAQAIERARYERLKADQQEMRNQAMRKELVPASLLEKILANTGRRIAVVLEGIIPRLRREISGLDPAVVKVLQDELVRARNEAATLEFPLEALDGSIRAEAAAPQRPAGDESASGPAAVAMG